MNYEEFLARSRTWRKTLDEIKRKNPPSEFTWYGYDILGSAEHIDRLLPPEHRDLFSRVYGQPIADIGTADGDLGYLLASIGFEVDLIDWPATNWNGMRGVKRLGELLASNASIHAVDLDSQFTLPRQQYGLVLFLGILYHLKNPYFILEQLAQRTRYCLLSTRVARFSKTPRVELTELPVAYLLKPDECNNDATNFWIFSVGGLTRLVERCGFRILAMRTVGDSLNSNPSDSANDERAFLLLESFR